MTCHRYILRIDHCIDGTPPLVGLQKQDNGNPENGFIFEFTNRNQGKADYCIEQQNIPVIEQGMQLRKQEKQAHPPRKAPAKVSSPLLRIMKLNIKTKAEQ